MKDSAIFAMDGGSAFLSYPCWLPTGGRWLQSPHYLRRWKQYSEILIMNDILRILMYLGYFS